jgi:hypothetical protein
MEERERGGRERKAEEEERRGEWVTARGGRVDTMKLEIAIVV